MRKGFSKLLAIVLVLSLFSSFDSSAAGIVAATPYQSLLSASQFAIYQQVLEKANSYETGIFKPVADVSEQELEVLMNCFYNDHPELFWLNTGYKYAVNQQGSVTKIQLKYGISVEFIDNSKLMFEQALNNIVAGAAAYSDIVEKERYIHDTLCAMNSYQSNANISQSSYSALVFGSTMCAGYARAFQIACLRCGIPCYYVTGVSKDQNHAWNVVFINGDFYNVDITWDDCITDQTGAQAYSYFNKTTDEFSADHTLSDLSSQIGYL